MIEHTLVWPVATFPLSIYGSGIVAEQAYKESSRRHLAELCQAAQVVSVGVLIPPASSSRALTERLRGDFVTPEGC